MQYSDKQISIMESAEELFAEKGFDGTSVRDISEKAGVNLAMISYYFGSKEKLLEAIFTWRSESSKLVLEEIVSRPVVSALDKVYALVDYYIEKIMQQQNFHKVLVREQVNSSSAVIEEMILNMKKQNLGIIHRLIREGQEKGEIRNDLDITLMMTTMVATVNHLITTSKHHRILSGTENMGEAEYQKLIREKLIRHFKLLFKLMLSHEA